MIENKKIAHYKLVRKLGQGAAGVVYEGLDEKLRMKVAIKVLAPHIMNEPDMVERFEREARAAANLQHPHIAHVFFVDRTSTGLLFYAMEYLEGPSLAEVISKRMAYSGRQMLGIMSHIAGALKYASEKGIIHRDVKPANILVTPDRGAKLLDFGLAKLGAGDAGLTKTGIALGTPYYISPEQAQGHEVDFRSDMYSFGATCFEMLTGWPPYRASDISGILIKHIQAPVPHLQTINEAYPGALCNVIETMMAKQPQDRFTNYDRILATFEDIRRTDPEFMGTRWTFCQSCDCVTVLNRDGTCFRGHEVEPPPLQRHYYEVLLNGFRKPGARERLREYMVLSTGRPPVHIDHLLDRLPVTLTPRLAEEAAQTLKAKLVKLGGDIVLRRVDTELVPSRQQRRSLVFDCGTAVPRIDTPVREREPSQRAAAAPPKPAETTKKPSRLAVVGAVAVAIAVAVTAVLLAVNSGPVTAAKPVTEIADAAGVAPPANIPDPAPQEPENAVAAAPGPQAPDEPPEEDDNFVSVTGNSPEGTCAVTLIGSDRRELADRLALVCGQDISRSMVLLGTTDVPPMDITVDVRLPPVKPLTPLPANEDDDNDPMVIHGKGLDAVALRPYVIARIGDAVITGINPATPLWLRTGYALALVQRILPDAYNPHSRLKTMRNVLSSYLIDKGLREQSFTAMDQAAGFCAYLAAEYHFSSLARLAKACGDGGDDGEAFRETYSIPVELLRGRWFSSLRQQ